VKLTKSQLKQIIKEELQEAYGGSFDYGRNPAEEFDPSWEPEEELGALQTQEPGIPDEAFDYEILELAATALENPESLSPEEKVDLQNRLRSRAEVLRKDQW